MSDDQALKAFQLITKELREQRKILGKILTHVEKQGELVEKHEAELSEKRPISSCG
jgi:hypothetical protein